MSVRKHLLAAIRVDEAKREIREAETIKKQPSLKSSAEVNEKWNNGQQN